MCVCRPPCLCVYHVQTVPKEVRKGAQSFGTGVKIVCGSPGVGSVNQAGSSERAAGALTAEPSLWPHTGASTACNKQW